MVTAIDLILAMCCVNLIVAIITYRVIAKIYQVVLQREERVEQLVGTLKPKAG